MSTKYPAIWIHAKIGLDAEQHIVFVICLEYGGTRHSSPVKFNYRMVQQTMVEFGVRGLDDLAGLPAVVEIEHGRLIGASPS